MANRYGKAKATITHCVNCTAERGPNCHLNRRGHCAACAIEATAGAARDMHSRSGPYYERWLAAMRKLAE